MHQTFCNAYQKNHEYNLRKFIAWAQEFKGKPEYTDKVAFVDLSQRPMAVHGEYWFTDLFPTQACTCQWWVFTTDRAVSSAGGRWVQHCEVTDFRHTDYQIVERMCKTKRLLALANQQPHALMAKGLTPTLALIARRMLTAGYRENGGPVELQIGASSALMAAFSPGHQ